jgi:hypothetical protein
MSLQKPTGILENVTQQSLANHSIWFYISAVLIYVHIEVSDFHTRRYTFAGGRAVMASKTSFLASRLQLWHILL